MYCEKPLSDLYQQYVTENLSRNDLEGRIFQNLLDNSERYHLFEGNRDRWDEFLSWLYPRLKRAIDLYRDMGSSFDAYITGLIRSAAREYRCREADHHLTEYACWRARAEELEVCEAESEYLERPEDISIPYDIKPKHILFLLLKSYYFVSDELAQQVAEKIGMKSTHIRDLIDEVRKRRSMREAEIQNFKDRVHCQYYRCTAYQKRMNAALPGTEYHERMKKRFERAKQRYHAMKKRLGGMRVNASNRMIAEVMGIPKGTVDSGLFAIKNHLALYVDKVE